EIADDVFTAGAVGASVAAGVMAATTATLEAATITAASGAVPLLTALIAYWKMNEASGSRLDSVGTSHLTDVNTVAQGTGIINGGALYVKANNESLQRAADATINAGDIDFTFNFWLQWTTDPQSVQGWPIVLGKDSAGTSNSADYNLGWDNGAANLQWEVFAGGGPGSRTKIGGILSQSAARLVGRRCQLTLPYFRDI